MPLHSGKSWFRLLLFAAFMMVIGCSSSRDDIPFPRCLSADYFGSQPVGVNAHFSSKGSFIPEDGKYNDDEGTPNWGFHFNQVVRWENTKLKTNGDNLVVRTRGAWTSWSVDNTRDAKSEHLDLQKLEKLKYFGGSDNNLPSFDLVCSKDQGTPANECWCIREDSKPCWFRNGYGVYLLFKKTGDPDPNETLETMRYPKSYTVHIGYDSIAENGDGVFSLGNKLKDASGRPVELKPGWEIYVKILDRYYNNNAGGHSLEFLNGVSESTGTHNFLDSIYEFLKDTLLICSNNNCSKDSDQLAAAQVMFKNIAEKNVSFRNFVVAIIVLFIMISSLLYLFGMVQETKHDLLIRMMKVTLVITLISPGSFEFFYNHFLILFVKGTEQLIKTVTHFSPNLNDKQLFPFIDIIINKFFAYSVWKKLAGLFIYKMWVGILIIPMILIAIVLYTVLCFYAFVLFLSGFLGLAFLIAIMPLFLICILFTRLKSLFDGWVKLCISFCLQSVMVFTLVSLFGALIMDTLYRQLGFTTCYNKWLEIKLCTPSWMFGGFCIIDKEYFTWTPGQDFVPYSISQGTSNNAGTVKFTGGAGNIPIPPNYNQSGFRYIDYPFFSPFPESNYYIEDSDIILSDSCSNDTKNLARFTNSLLHASDPLDIRILIDKINQEIDQDSFNKLFIQYQEIIDINENGKKLKPGLSQEEIKDFVKEVIQLQCQLRKVREGYEENRDYQRIKDIQQSDLTSLSEVFILFTLSFLMLSLLSLSQEIGAALSGGNSTYTISSMYGNFSAITSLLLKPGNFIGNAINRVTSLPGRLFDGTTGLLGQVPIIGKGLKYLPRTLVYGAIETTKFITSPKNDVAKLEEKIYRAFGVDVDDIGHRKINKYLNYYKGYVGSHLGYTLNDAMKFYWSYGLHSIGGKSDQKKNNLGEFDHKNDLLYMAKLYRKDFLQKLYDETIGRKIKPARGQPNEGKKSEEIRKDDQTSKRKGLTDDDVMNEDNYLSSFFDDYQKRIEREERKREVDSDDFGVHDLSSFFDDYQKRVEREERKREVDSDDFGVHDLSPIFDKNSDLNQTEKKNSKEEVEVTSSKIALEKDNPNQGQQSEKVKAFQDSSDHHGRKGFLDEDAMKQKHIEREERKREVDSENVNSDQILAEKKNSKGEDTLKENNISFDHSRDDTEERRNDKINSKQISGNISDTFKQENKNEKAGSEQISSDSKKFEIRQNLTEQTRENVSENPKREGFIDKNKKTNEITKSDKELKIQSEEEDK